MSRERRIRTLSLAALVVLLPAALWTDAHEDVSGAWQHHAFKPIDAARSSTTQFAGLQWRLISLDERENVKTPDRREITVRVQVELDTPDALQALRRCQAYLEDSTGRRWSPLPSINRQLSCSQLGWRAAADRTPAQLTERFAVPSARAADVGLIIVMPDERPRYLRFRRRTE
jgi:hypothetical protein